MARYPLPASQARPPTPHSTPTHQPAYNLRISLSKFRFSKPRTVPFAYLVPSRTHSTQSSRKHIHNNPLHATTRKKHFIAEHAISHPSLTIITSRAKEPRESKSRNSTRNYDYQYSPPPTLDPSGLYANTILFVAGVECYNLSLINPRIGAFFATAKIRREGGLTAWRGRGEERNTAVSSGEFFRSHGCRSKRTAAYEE